MHYDIEGTHYLRDISGFFFLDIVLTVAADSTANMWNLFTGDCIRTFGGADGRFKSVMLA